MLQPGNQPDLALSKTAISKPIISCTSCQA